MSYDICACIRRLKCLLCCKIFKWQTTKVFYTDIHAMRSIWTKISNIIIYNLMMFTYSDSSFSYYYIFNTKVSHVRALFLMLVPILEFWNCANANCMMCETNDSFVWFIRTENINVSCMMMTLMMMLLLLKTTAFCRPYYYYCYCFCCCFHLFFLFYAYLIWCPPVNTRVCIPNEIMLPNAVFCCNGAFVLMLLVYAVLYWECVTLFKIGADFETIENNVCDDKNGTSEHTH